MYHFEDMFFTILCKKNCIEQNVTKKMCNFAPDF